MSNSISSLGSPVVAITISSISFVISSTFTLFTVNFFAFFVSNLHRFWNKFCTQHSFSATLDFQLHTQSAVLKSTGLLVLYTRHAPRARHDTLLYYSLLVLSISILISEVLGYVLLHWHLQWKASWASAVCPVTNVWDCWMMHAASWSLHSIRLFPVLVYYENDDGSSSKLWILQMPIVAGDITAALIQLTQVEMMRDCRKLSSWSLWNSCACCLQLRAFADH